APSVKPNAHICNQRRFDKADIWSLSIACELVEFRWKYGSLRFSVRPLGIQSADASPPMELKNARITQWLSPHSLPGHWDAPLRRSETTRERNFSVPGFPKTSNSQNLLPNEFSP